MGDLL